MSAGGQNAEQITRVILVAQFAATWAMVGIIWFVQAVHYRLFEMVGAEGFEAYHQKHTNLTTWIVGPPMLVELFAALSLLWFPPADVPRFAVWVGILLVGILWISTAVVQVPLHSRLASGFQASASRKLCATNWLRTMVWSLRGGLVVWMVWKAG